MYTCFSPFWYMICLVLLQRIAPSFAIQVPTNMLGFRPLLRSSQKTCTTTMVRASSESAGPIASKEWKLRHSGVPVMLTKGAKANGWLSHELIENVTGKYGYKSILSIRRIWVKYWPFKPSWTRILTGRMWRRILPGETMMWIMRWRRFWCDWVDRSIDWWRFLGWLGVSFFVAMRVVLLTYLWWMFGESHIFDCPPRFSEKLNRN